MSGFLVGAVKAAGAGFEGWASTSQLDRQGDIVLPEAFASSIEAFRANGPIFWGHAEIHNPLAKPIGRATDAVIRDGGLHIKARWAQTAEAQEVRGLVTDGIVSTLSVGFNPKMAETRGGVNYITDLELLEVSVVAIPANIGAVITAAKTLASFADSGETALDDAMRDQITLRAVEPATVTVTEDGHVLATIRRRIIGVAKAAWSSAYIADLPDSAFACIDGDGRHYPHHNASGALDLPHLRAALSRIGDPANAQCGKGHLAAHARAAGVGD